MGNAIALAKEAFGKTLEELERRQQVTDFGKDPVALGRRAALLIMAESIWGQHLGALLETEELKTLLGVKSRQAVSDLVKRGKVLALDAAGNRKLYPAFQFGPGGRPYPEIAEVLKIFTGAVSSPYTIASWLVSPIPLLGQETPAAWMRKSGDPEPLFEAARRSASRLAH
ncbi:MAG TPA: hypothetical protein VKK31_04420 [Thermoanaerobaculia bacterium]|nr:hypothetical protein [Thermoanaerobaculia bacterium]